MKKKNQKNIQKTLRLRRQFLASEFSRCHSDNEKRLVLGAELVALNDLVTFAGLKKSSNAEMIREIIKGKLGRLERGVFTTRDTSGVPQMFTRDITAINAQREIYEEGLRIFA